MNLIKQLLQVANKTAFKWCTKATCVVNTLDPVSLFKPKLHNVVIKYLLTHFKQMLHLYTPWNYTAFLDPYLGFSNVFKEYRNETLACNELMKILLLYFLFTKNNGMNIHHKLRQFHKAVMMVTIIWVTGFTVWRLKQTHAETNTSTNNHNCCFTY